MKNNNYKQTEPRENRKNWSSLLLKDIVEKVIDNRGKTPPIHEHGIELLEVNSVVEGKKYPDYEKVSKYVDEETFSSWFRSGHPKKEDILFPTVGTIGIAAVMNENKGSIAQNLVALRINKNLASPDFVYYLLTSPQVKKSLFNLNIGGVQPSIKVPHLLNLQIAIPSLQKQGQIASILSSLDDKIELNRKMNNTLEEMGKALFKRWFVDFEFPNENGKPYKSSGGEMVDSEMGEIPTGWELTTLREVVDYYIGGGWGQEAESAEYGVPAYVIRGTDIPNINDGNVTTCPFRYHKASNYETRQLHSQDLIIEVSGGSKEQPVGRTTIVDDNILNQFNGRSICASFCKLVRVKNDLINPFIIFWKIKSLYETEDIYRYQEQSTGISNFKFEYFLDDLKVVVPSKRIHELSKYIFNIIHFQLTNNGIENRKLSQIRDSLLPRLMSGKLRI